ncbi:hypothetical protein Tco_1247567 [Tanacetum coccineum]
MVLLASTVVDEGELGPELRCVQIAIVVKLIKVNVMVSITSSECTKTLEDTIGRRFGFVGFLHALANAHFRTQNELFVEIGELRAIFGHMLGAAEVQIPEDNLDDLHSSREEDGTLETMDPRD